jgi:hypothetical protein
VSAVTWLDDPAALAAAIVPPEWPSVDAAAIARQRPDASALVRDAGGAVTARASVWWRRTPEAAVGVIGHYGARDEAAGRAVLDAATARLAAAGCRRAIGPMDGTTWERYRLTLPTSDAPPFLLEPVQPADWPTHWEAAGFSVIERYRSDRAPLEVLEARDPAAVAARMAEHGVTITTFTDHAPADVIAAIHAVSVTAFAEAAWFTPIDRETLQAQYAPAVPLADPDFVLLAWHDGAPAGFVFAVPDWLEARRTGAPPAALVIKTVAVRPGVRALAGLGGLLLARVAAKARARGMRDGIHALMRDDNARARAFGAGVATLVRQYALYGRTLAEPRDERRRMTVTA